jgi:hypothetical protein
MSSSNPADSGPHPPEIGALGDRKAVQVAAQVVKAKGRGELSGVSVDGAAAGSFDAPLV